MSTRSSAKNLFPPLDNPELTIRRRSRSDPTLLNNFEMAAEGPGDLPVPDLRTMKELCQPSLNGWGGPIVPIAIQATNFGLKNDMNQQSIKVNGVTDDTLHLYLFPHSLTHHATAWFDRLPRNSINTFEQMAKMFLGKYFPPSMVTKLRNEITNFRQRLDESLFEAWERYKISIDRCPNHNITEDVQHLVVPTESPILTSEPVNSPIIEHVASPVSAMKPNLRPSIPEAWDRFKDLLRACPRHGFLELHQLDMFYNGLNSKDQDSLNSAASGNFLDKMPRECLAIIESKSKVFYSRNKPVVDKVSTNTSTSGISPDVAELKDMVKALLLDKKTYVKANDAVMRNMQNQLTNLTDLLTKFMNSNNASTSSSGTLPSNTIANSRSDLKAITTRSAVLLKKLSEKLGDPGKFLIPCDFLGMAECLALADLGACFNLMPLSVWNELSLPDLSPTCMTLELVDRLISRPVETRRALIDVFEGELTLRVGKEAITFNLDQTSRYSANYNDMTANRIDVINMASEEYSQELSLPDLSPACMTLELTDRSISRPVGVAEDVYVKVGTFYFLADFVIVDFDANPRVPLILERSFLKTGRALIDMFEGELTLRVGKEVITFNLDQTLRYSSNYIDMTENRIDVIDMACEEYSQEVLYYSNVITSSNPTPYYDLIVSTTSLTLTPFENTNYLPKVRKELKICEAKSDKSSIDEPPKVELKDLPPYLEYVFLEGDDKLPVIIAKDLSVEEKTALITVLKSHKRAIAWKLSDIKDQEKTTFTCPYEMFAYRRMPFRLCNAPGMFQWCMMAIFHDMIEKTMEVFMDDLSVFGNSFQICLSHLGKMLKRCKDINLCLNWEKSHFMVKEDQEKTTFTCPYETFAYSCMPFGLCNEPDMFQRCIMAIFHDMIKKTMEVFMDDFLVFENSFQACLSHLEKMLKRFEDTNLCLNWEKSHFMVKECIVLDHKISKEGIKVDKAKVDVIAKLPHPTTVKGIRSFLGHADFYRRFIKDFSKIARPMTRLLEKDTPFLFSKECVEAFQTLKRKLIEVSILIAPDWDMPFELMCDASDFAIGAVLGNVKKSISG
nr:reverse transcriptase domain-containing protein [Tanacetum cinerariifolium]